MTNQQINSMQKNKIINLEQATGKMQFTLTNDYLFRATLQKSKRALKGLLCSLLGLQPQDIISAEITNPVELGKSIEAKDFILDIRVLLNDQTVINIEMQVLNYGNWPERSLGYLCRSFDSLNKGQNYTETKPVVQISFLDFTIFKENSEFFSNYLFMNEKNHVIYSDKLKLSVVDLTQIDKATEEDRLRGIDFWARLFKATTWEEVKMFAEKNEYLAEAAETAYQLSTEENIRMQCEAREDFYRQQSYVLYSMDKLKQEREKLEKENASLEKENASLEETNVSLKETNVSLKETNETLKETNEILKENNAFLEEENRRLKEQLEKLTSVEK